MGALRVYASAILLSAALLFSVQPMFAKMALPLLGGTPAVWNTCMVFFQALLLAGYGYAHLTTRWLGERTQAMVHLVICLLPLAALPIVLPAGWKPPTETTPVFWLLGLLGVAVGAPFFVLSATAPLLQHWFSRTDHPSAADPYFLYAASNVGSMAALLGYPFLIEPALRLEQQSQWWSWGYVALCVLLVICAAFLWFSKSRAAMESGRAEDVRPQSRRVVKGRPTVPAATEVTPGRRLRWVALSFIPSSWLLGVTTHITTDIAPVPLLWVIPLALYLLSFILVFSERTRIVHTWMVWLFAPALLLLVMSVIMHASWPLLVSAHLVVFFVGCMVCHGDLAQLRPPVSHLTEFYLWMSAGGVLGGMFNAIVAPLVFRWSLEYPIAVFLAAWLRSSLYFETRKKKGRLADLSILLAIVVVFAAIPRVLTMEGNANVIGATLSATLVLVVFYYLDWPRPFALGVGTLLILAKLSPPVVGTIHFTGRSFYGVHWVVDDEIGRQLLNGSTKHGVQSLDPARRCEPLSYYWSGSPLGQVFSAFRRPATTNKAAVIGLGAGATVCYRDKGYRFTFYEIDPLVKQIAEAPELFTYLSHCGRDAYEIVLGDGRLRLAEAPQGEYALIVFDAFSSDAIPLHLLTREALAMYLDKLAEGGILVFHTSNRHLDLSPVLAGLAADAGMICLLGNDEQQFPTDREFETGRMPSKYVVLARDRDAVAGLTARGDWRELAPSRDLRLWTDDYSSLVGILKWK